MNNINSCKLVILCFSFVLLVSCNSNTFETKTELLEYLKDESNEYIKHNVSFCEPCHAKKGLWNLLLAPDQPAYVRSLIWELHCPMIVQCIMILTNSVALRSDCIFGYA